MLDGDGNPNFENLVGELWPGDPTQLKPITLSLGTSSGPTSVGLPLDNSSPSAPGSWKTAVVTQPGVAFIDLRFIVSQLYSQTKKGVDNATASIEIELLPSGASNWVNILLDTAAPTYNANGINQNGVVYYLPRSMFDTTTTWKENTPGILTITGKTTSAYVKEMRIAVPNTGSYANKTWQVRCRLREIDYQVSGSDGENEVRRTIQWESIAGVSKTPIGNTESWRGLAYLRVFGRANDQLNGIPEISGIYDLNLYQVPPSSVWNPETRKYVSGATWDGVTTQLAWTTCPAFQIKGLIEDGLSGISALVPGSTLNKWDALEASKWFATLVPDGKGGTHPRYSANWFIDQPMQANELVNYLAGAVGAFCWDEGDGRWRMRVEKSERPVMVFTRENIVGEFTYSHTDFDSRFNDYIGVFRNEDNLYEEDRLRVFDQSDIDINGRKHTTLALVGCTNRQEALRRLKIRLLSTTKEIRIVNFTTNRQAELLEPFSVIAVADNDLNANVDQRSTTRILSLNAARTQITLRDTVRLEVGVDYTITLTVPNADYAPGTSSQPATDNWRKRTSTITRTVTNTSAQRGDVFTLFLSSALPANTPEFAAFALDATGLPALPKQYRVLSIEPNDDGETYAVTGIEIYTAKWTESDNVNEDEILAQVPNREVPPPLLPEGGDVLTIRTFQSEQGVRQSLVASWMRPKALNVSGFRVSYQFNGGPTIVLHDRLTSSSTDIPDPSPGVYKFTIQTIDRIGNLSVPLTDEIEVGQVILTADDIVFDNGETIADLVQGAIDLVDGKVETFYQVNPPVGASNGDLWFDIDDGNKLYRFNGIGWEVVQDTAIGDAITAAAGAQATADGKVTTYFTDTEPTDPALGDLWSKPSNGDLVRWNGTGWDLIASVGSHGLNNATIILYKRATSTPTGPTTTTTYNFATKTLTGQNNGWTQTIPSGTDPIYAVAATASSSASTDTIPANEWSSPVVLAKNGEDGLNTASVFLYIRSATVPSVPSTTATYTFTTSTLTGHNNGWAQSVPSGSDPLYVITATAASTGPTDTISSGEWATPRIMAQNGSQGPSGLNNATVVLYRRATSTPAVPSTTSTYTFATAVLSGQNNGWTQAFPSGTDPLYAIAATASSSGTTDTIASGEWSSPTILTKDGLNTASVYLYQRSATTPAVPSTTATYTFTTSVLTGHNNGWSQTVPDPDGNPLWIITATAASTGTTDTITSGEWATPQILAQNGVDGAGVPTLIAYDADGDGASYSIIGDTITKTGVNLSTDSVYSQEAYGTFYLRAIAPSVSSRIGVSTTVPNNNPPCNFRLQSESNGLDQIWHNGTMVWSANLPANSVLEMVGDGKTIKYIINGELTHTGEIASPGPWQLCAWFSSKGYSMTGIRYGPSGAAGADGLSIAELTIYRRAASQPSIPSGGSYNFATKTLTPPSGWTTTWPTTGSGPIWASSGVVAIQGTSGTATPTWYGVGGGISDGSTGESGYSVAQIKLYRRLATQPALPTATLTYTFATDTLSGSLGNWSRTQPADNGLPLWVTSAVASSQGASDAIGIAEWVTPVIEGQTPPKTAIAFIYKRTSTSGGGPLPSGTATYTFATGAITGLNNSWSSDIPSGSAPLYRCQAAALSNGTTASIGGGDWGPAQLMAENGADGVPGEATNIVFRRASSQPSTPSPSSGVPSSWYDDTGSVPTGAGYIWASFGTRSSPASNWTWQTPKKVEGTDGVSPLSIIINPPSVTIQGNAGGTPKSGELPTAVAVSAKRGGSAVTVTSISVTSTDNCSASVSGTSVRFTAAGAGTGSATVSVTAGGETQTGIIIPITVVPAGADGSTSTTIGYSSPQITSTSYVSYTPTLAANASSTGKIRVSGTANYKVTQDGSSELQARGKLQISSNGSTWTDIAGSETLGTWSRNLFEPTMVSNGRITFPEITATGLTANGAYQIRLQLRKESSASQNSVTMNASILAERVT